MRLRTLHLVRYGKFTDHTLEFPPSQRDFHLVVGRNEAGKSTVRSAISELLFGLPRSSPLDFVHPQSELRLGATLEGEAGAVAFHRAKTTRSPLRTPADAPLPDDLLGPYLGGADRAFFEQMFGLDHDSLVRGGRLILDARSDVGAALFQSAAGIASLGAVRERLADEANRIWAPRKSADRDYYKGQAQLDEASRALREAQVRTPAWVEARARCDAAARELEEAQARGHALETQRAQLERVRRLAPQLLALRARQAELAELGETLELPPDAQQTLAQGQAALAQAQVDRRLRAEAVAAREQARQAIVLDAAALALSAPLQALAELRIRCVGHAQQLLQDEREAALALAAMQRACAQLGWPQDEAQARTRLPSPLARRAVTALAGERGAIFESLRGAQRDLERAQAEAEALQTQWQAAAPVAVSPQLAPALAAARALGQPHSRERALEQALRAAQAALDARLAALAPWALALPALRALAAPTAERLAGLLTQRQALASDRRRAADQDAAAQARRDATALKLRQFTQGQRVVGDDEVREARRLRDDAWSRIKQGAPLEVGAPLLDAAMLRADERADARLADAAGAAQLQALRDQLALHTLEAEVAARELAGREAAVDAFDQAWSTQAAALGLAAMPLEDLPGWLERRERALLAAVAVDEARQALDTAQNDHDGVAQALRAALGEPSEGASLASLLAQAEARLDAATAAAAARDSLQDQRQRAQAQIQARRLRLDEAARDAAQWQSAWRRALGAAGVLAVAGEAQAQDPSRRPPAGDGEPQDLFSAAPSPAEPVDGEPGTSVDAGDLARVEAAMELVETVAARLADLERIRRDSIDRRRAELARFENDTRQLAQTLDMAGPDAPQEPDALCARLLARLAQAQRADQEAETAQRDLRSAQQALAESEIRLQTAQAAVAPLLAAAGVETIEQALPLAARSARKRQLAAEIGARRDAALADGDGLSLAMLEAEVDAHDALAVPGLLEQLKSQQRELALALASVSAQRAQADLALSAISGHALAATAEAQRQEALSAMADAAERYLHVATAARLLRWSIDRYRDRKQGPMLERASAVFSQLTLGGFARLMVDEETSPPTLSARRESGEVVSVAGMSEGTRDQLFLALRLAALELHLAQGRALPFVADDLFVNFDDARSAAGLRALGQLSTRTQVIFLTHHEHLVPVAREVFGDALNVTRL